MSVLADSAIAYAQSEGLYVFPLQQRGKVPLTSHGLDDATTDGLTIETWWDRWPDANIAIRTGDLVVIDEDRPGALAELAEQHNHEIPETRVARTGKGRHFYFTQPTGQRIRNTAGKLAQGIDTRGDGGYVVAPPSVHPDGGVYEWESTAPPAVFPDWIARLLTRPEPKHFDPLTGRNTPYGQRALEQELHHVATATEGTRNDTLNTAAFSLAQLVAGREIDEHDALHSLRAAARACGLPERESEPTIMSGFNAGLADPRRAPDTGNVHQLRPKEPTPSTNATVAAVPQARITVETWETFNRNSQAELEFLIDDLWPTKSFAFIASPPKKGKTWLGLAAAISIATGTRFISEFEVSEPRPVLYLALEGARPAIRARIGALSRGLNLDPDNGDLRNLDLAYRPRGINLADPEWAAEITNVAANNAYAAVFVDVLRNAARIKESDAAEFAHLRSLLEPALAHTSICLLHHFTKLSELSKERTPAERMSGSGAMYGALDVGIFITGSDDHARKLRIEFDGRDIAMPDPVSVYLEGAGSGPNGSLLYTDKAFWHGNIPEVEEEDLKGPATEIAAWVRKRGGEVAMREAAEHFEITDDTMRTRRSSLEQLGIDWVRVSVNGRMHVHLIDHSRTFDGAETRPESEADPNSGSVRNAAWLSQSRPETERPESGDSVGAKSSDLQVKPPTRPNRLPTGVAPDPDGSVPPSHDIDFSGAA